MELFCSSEYILAFSYLRKMHIIFSSLEPLTNEHFLNNHLLYIWTEIFKVQFDWGACGFGPPATAAELISALMALTQKAFTAPSAVAAYRWPPTAHPGSHPILPFGAASCSCCSGMIYIQSEHVVRVFFFCFRSLPVARVVVFEPWRKLKLWHL